MLRGRLRQSTGGGAGGVLGNTDWSSIASTLCKAHVHVGTCIASLGCGAAHACVAWVVHAISGGVRGRPRLGCSLHSDVGSGCEVVEGVDDGVEVDHRPRRRLLLAIQEVCDQREVLSPQIRIQELQILLVLWSGVRLIGQEPLQAIVPCLQPTQLCQGNSKDFTMTPPATKAPATVYTLDAL